MEVKQLRLINRALKVSVNTVDRDNIGYPVILEAKDMLEKELAKLDPLAQANEEKASAKQNIYQTDSSVSIDPADMINILTEIYNKKCTQFTKNNIAVKTCRHTWPDEPERWCGTCYMKARVGK